MAHIIKKGPIKVPTQPKDFGLQATGLVFKSYDNQIALEFNVTQQDGAPADLLGATLRLLMYVYDEADGTVTKEPVPFITKNLITESFLNGHVKYILPEALKAYSGVVETYVYIEYPDGSTSDNLGFTFRMKRSAIDGLAQDKADYFIEDFKQLLDGVKQEATDAVNEALAKVEVVSENVSSAQNDLTILEDRIDQANQEIDKVLSGANEFRTDIDTLKINKADKTFVTAQLAQKADNSTLDVERKRIDAFTKLSEGSTTGDAELIDARIGYDGVVYESAGDSVRKQVIKLNRNLKNLAENGVTTLEAYGGFVRADMYDGILSESIKYRVSSNVIFAFDRDIKLTINNGFRIRLFFFSNGVYSNMSNWTTGEYTVPKNTPFKIVIARVTENTSETADVLEFVSSTSFSSILSENINKNATNISQAAKNIDELKKQTLYNMVNTSAKSKTLNGVTLTNNNDGTYTVNGTASVDTLFHLNDVSYFEKSVDSGIYKVLGCPQNGGESTYYLETAFKNVKGEVKANRKDIGNGTEPLYLEEPMVSMYLAIGIKAGQTVNQLVFKPMFTKNLDTTYNDFVGYTGENDKLNKNVAEIQKKLSEKPDAAYPSNLYWEDTVKPPYWIFHLDCARKYFTVANVKLLIDKISKSGFNQIQLHFSEDSGFRLELDNMMVTDEDGVSYDLSGVLGGTESPDKWYTQADMDSIISYAQSKNIDVVPSFDMPGHMGRILYRFPQFKLEGSNTLDITNDVAVKFAKAIVKKYCKYFSSRGSHHWNIGYDEIVGSKGFDLFYNEGNYKFVVDFANTLINAVKEYDLIPRMYNEAVYYNKDYNYYVSKDVELYYWYTDWAEYTLPDVLQKSGYKLINNSYKYYWILDNEENSTSVDVINQTELLKDFYNRKTDKNGYGAVFAIWCDSANTSISKGDGGDGVVSSVSSLITAFGNAISRAYEQ
ncbi:family 20 glycosylhydrolase [Enterococcus faecium]|uniref:family 20 glycosylhydrolase n=1 Tax=Enterococcus faecium TaxID=1352 RepID=UPI00177B702A|nr:family 20 glycosylhydrolase [Enterococcus faecium]MBD9712248.1 family 20 glycosylhydrolase [Enterococcus faecium]MBD9715157.1 family 20 glycosylhydrolase [Enterococcus faecium]MBD9737040.1 family 20 glycosylhydrolase [Enterococcus faecium]